MKGKGIMNWQDFIVVGENIHCTRIVMRNGKRATTLADGTEAVIFKHQGSDRSLPVPANWGAVSPAFEQGKIKHAALGLYQAMHGTGASKADGEAYLCWMAERQINAGAVFLDVNVDEYSNDSGEVNDAMVFLVDFLGGRYDTPLSIDSSDPETLRTGLERCRRNVRPPMLNSVSLERTEAVSLVSEFNTDVIVSAAGRSGMPCTVGDRMENLRDIIGMLDDQGVGRGRMHVDPLVLPISTDPMNGATFLEANREVRAEFEGVHLSGGLSNISFGMPNRKLLNMVFTYLCAQTGTDGGIIDPVSMPVRDIAALDPASDAFKMAEAVLTGQDMFGMDYITAYREGRLN